MSTKSSLWYWAVGDYAEGTEWDLHYFHDCLDDRYYLEATAMSKHVFRLRLPWRRYR